MEIKRAKDKILKRVNFADMEYLINHSFVQLNDIFYHYTNIIDNKIVIDFLKFN